MSYPKSPSHPASSRRAERSNVSAAKRKPAVRKLAKDKTISVVKKQTNAWTLSYVSVYRATPLERIALIKKGFPASQVKHLFVDLRLGQGAGFKALNLSTATVNKKAKKGELLSAEESERVIGFAKLVGQLEAIILESGDRTDFDGRAWMARWLTEPLPAFGGARPADLIDTMEGQGLVASALAKLQTSAYA